MPPAKKVSFITTCPTRRWGASVRLVSQVWTLNVHCTKVTFWVTVTARTREPWRSTRSTAPCWTISPSRPVHDAHDSPSVTDDTPLGHTMIRVLPPVLVARASAWRPESEVVSV